MLHDVNRGIQELRLQRLSGVPGRDRRKAAEALLEPARALPGQSFRAAVTLELADGWLTENPDAALASAREARALISDNVAPNLMALALTIEAEALSAQGCASEAYALLRRAVPLAERQRKHVADPMLRATSMRERIRVYDAAVRAALTVGDLEYALATTELARPRLELTPAPTTIAGLQGTLADDEALLA